MSTHVVRAVREDDLPFLQTLAASVAGAARSDFPQPRALEPDVTFWKRIYSEVGTDGGLIHDTHDLGLVYEVVKFPSARGADAHTEARKRYYQGILRALATGKRAGLSRDEQRVLAQRQLRAGELQAFVEVRLQ